MTDDTVPHADTSSGVLYSPTPAGDGCQFPIGGRGETSPLYHKGRYMLYKMARAAPLSNLDDLLSEPESIASTTIETRFYLGSVLEEAIAQLPGVHSVHITSDQYWIDDIEVHAARGSAPLALRVEILTCLLVGFGVLVDDACVRIVQSP